LKSKPDADRAVRALIQRQRDLAHSTRSPTRLRILWFAATLDKRLEQCTDHEVGDLMVIDQGRLDYSSRSLPSAITLGAS
jgi:hypothetical protein